MAKTLSVLLFDKEKEQYIVLIVFTFFSMTNKTSEKLKDYLEVLRDYQENWSPEKTIAWSPNHIFQIAEKYKKMEEALIQLRYGTWEGDTTDHSIIEEALDYDPLQE